MKVFFFLKKKKIFIPILIILFIGGFILTQSKNTKKPEFSSQIVKRIDLKQTVNETGSVEASLELKYGWEVGGKVVEILKLVGNTVSSDEIIARLGNEQQKARYEEAVALLSSAQARLSLELAGPSDEAKKKSYATITQAEAALTQSKANLAKVESQAIANVLSAEKALDTAKNNLQIVESGERSQLIDNVYADLLNSLQSAIITLSNALTISDNILGVDNTFANDDFDKVLGVLNISTLNTAKSTYLQAKIVKQKAENAIFLLTYLSKHEDIDTEYDTTLNAITVMQGHLFDVQAVLNATSPIGNLSQSGLDTLKSNITNVRMAINASIISLTNARQTVKTAKNSLTSHTIAYDKAISDFEQIKKQTEADIAVARAQVVSQEANVLQAKATHDDLITPPRDVELASIRADIARQVANLSAFRYDLEKTELVALTSGIINKLEIEVGENVVANQDVITIISNGFIIDVDISEADIAKLSLYDPVHITLDAYGEDVFFTGNVVKIEPAETKISGVVYYNTKILFDKIVDNYDVRPGMTANVEIQTDIREQILAIPRRSILTRDGKKFVRIVIDKEKGIFEERTVETGLAGDYGMIEIVKGLAEGEEIVTFLKE